MVKGGWESFSSKDASLAATLLSATGSKISWPSRSADIIHDKSYDCNLNPVILYNYTTTSYIYIEVYLCLLVFLY